MRFVLTVDQAIAVAGLMLIAGFCWHIGAWLAGKVTSRF
jgi:hypothetical protein